MNNVNTFDNQNCPCGSEKHYYACCQPYHLKQAFPETAEKLMRSRFSAFELHLEDYLLESWHQSTRPGNLEFTPGLHWIKLVINGRKKGRIKDQEGWVTFIAYFEHGNEQAYLHEKSYFKRDELNHWKYVDGDVK